MSVRICEKGGLNMKDVIAYSDLSYIHNEIKDELDAAVRKVIDSNWFIMGE